MDRGVWWVTVHEVAKNQTGQSMHPMLLLPLLSHISHVWLCVTPQMAAWSGLPFPSPVHESEEWKWSRSVMSDSSWPHDCTFPGSSAHGISQARVLAWGATAFSVHLQVPANPDRFGRCQWTTAKWTKWQPHCSCYARRGTYSTYTGIIWSLLHGMLLLT